MCGIAGIVGNYSKSDVNKIRENLSLISHRGPDDIGIAETKDGILGHVRLSIIDLDTGHQPMFNETGKVSIVFNGEIYNYQELRKKLSRHRFRTNSDTEVILHLYEEYGPECASMLDGMFSFIILDK